MIHLALTLAAVLFLASLGVGAFFILLALFDKRDWLVVPLLLVLWALALLIR